MFSQLYAKPFHMEIVVCFNGRLLPIDEPDYSFIWIMLKWYPKEFWYLIPFFPPTFESVC